MLSTERLLLREWRQEDLAPFSRLNVDSDVMRYFPSVQDERQSAAAIKRISGHFDDYGFCFWAAELKETGKFIGFIGMQHAPADLPCAPAVEIGWRLDKAVWGQGLAPEGARACLLYAFSKLALGEVVSFTALSNQPSQRVMEKIGMKRDEKGDFEHPAVSAETGLREHVLYRIGASDPILF